MTRLSVCRVALTGAALFLTACGGQNIALREPVIPPPLMEQLNYRVAVQYSKEMYDYTHKEELLGNKKWTISLGEANKRVYDQLFSALFSDVTYLSPDENINGREFDLVMRPSIQAFEFALPQQSRTDAYTVWIRYQIELFNRFGSKIGTWPINAYGKSGAGRFEGSEAIQRAAALAMRDAAALVSMRLSAQAKKLSDSGIGGPNDPALVALDNAPPADASDTTVAETANGGNESNPTIESAEKLRDD